MFTPVLDAKRGSRCEGLAAGSAMSRVASPCSLGGSFIHVRGGVCKPSHSPCHAMAVEFICGSSALLFIMTGLDSGPYFCCLDSGPYLLLRDVCVLLLPQALTNKEPFNRKYMGIYNKIESE